VNSGTVTNTLNATIGTWIGTDMVVSLTQGTVIDVDLGGLGGAGRGLWNSAHPTSWTSAPMPSTRNGLGIKTPAR
jgi:hypothetical protein